MEDFETQQADLRGRLQTARQGTRYQNPQGRMVGRIYVAPNPLEYLSEALRSANAGREAQMATGELKDLQGKKQTAMADALRTYTDKATGAPAVASTTTPTQMPSFDEADAAGMQGVQGYGATTGAQAARAPDPRGANASLMNAPDAALRQMGMKGMMEMAQKDAAKVQQQQHIDILRNAKTPQDALAAGVPFETVKNFTESKDLGRQKVQYKDVGGKLVPVTEYGDQPTGVKPLDKTGNPFSDLVLSKDGVMVPNAPLVKVKGQIAEKGKSNVTVNNKGPAAFDVELSKLDAKQLDQWRDKSEAARNSLSVAQRLKDAEAKGAYSGGLADQKLAAANMINGITGITPKGLVGSQLYNAEASKLVLEHVKTLGANPSNADREFIEKTVPRLATSQEARQQMAEFIEKSAQRTISTFDTMDQYARANRGLGGFKFPEMPGVGGQNGGVGNAGLNEAVEAEIKRRQGGR
jgi:hypothetical protein